MTSDDTPDERDHPAADPALDAEAAAEGAPGGAATAGAAVDPSLAGQADQTEHHSVGRNSALMASGTMVSRVLGLLRTSLLGGAIGFGIVGDAFNGANQLPNYIFLLISGGLLEPIIVPQLTRAGRRADGREYADKLITASLTLALVIAVLATVAAPLLFRLVDVGPEARWLGVVFAFICLPQVFFYCMHTILSQVLNSRGRYAAAMWAPALNNVVSIIGLAAFIITFGWRQEDPAAWSWPMIWLLTGTTTLGIVGQALILVPALRADGFTWRPRWGMPRADLGQLSRYTVWTFLALVISTIGGLIILSVASGMPTRAEDAGLGGFVAGNAVMNNAFLIFMLPQSVIAISVITALFPPMTRAWQADDKPAMRRLVKQGLELPAVFLIPATAVIIALALPIVRTIFFRNDPQAWDALAQVLIAMSLGIVPMAIQTLQQKYCFASEQGRVNLVFQLVITGTQVLLAALTVAFVTPRYGVLMIGLNQSFAYLVVAIAFVAFTRRQLGGLSLSGTLKLFVRLLVASVVAGGAAWLTSYLIGMVGDAWVWQALILVAGGLVFVAVFTLAAKLMRITQYFDLLNPILRRLHLPQVR